MSKKMMENYLQTYQKFIPDNKVEDKSKKKESSSIENNRKTNENSLEASSNNKENSLSKTDLNTNFQSTNNNSMVSMDPKLLESFLLFQNFMKMQNQSKDESEIKIEKVVNNKVAVKPDIKEEEDEIEINNNDSHIDDDDVVEINNYKNEDIENNFNATEDEYDLNANEPIIIQHSNKDEIEVKIPDPSKNNLYNEDAPIQRNNKNFMELLEENLEKDDYVPSNIIVRKGSKRERFKKDIKVSSPKDGKKYKYYSQNFENDFGSSNANLIDQKGDLKTKKEEKIFTSKSKEKTIDKISNQIKKEDKINLENTKEAKTLKNVKELIVSKTIKKEANYHNEEKLSISPAPVIQSKMKILPNQFIPNKLVIDGPKNINDKLKMEVIKMKNNIDSDDENQDDEELKEDSIHSDDRNLENLLNIDLKTNTNKTELKAIKNTDRPGSNSNNILKKYFGIQGKSVDKKLSEVHEETVIDNKHAEREQLKLIVNEKMNELNNEIKRLQNTNEKVSKLKADFERNSTKLSKDIDDYNLDKENKEKDFEILLEEEKNKFQKEKKLHEKNLKAIIMMPNKKEREEIENLKIQLQKLNDDNKKKEQNNKLNMDRLKKQLDEANNKISEMSKEVKFMEEMKTNNWDKNSKTTQKTSTTTPSVSLKNDGVSVSTSNTVNNKTQQKSNTTILPNNESSKLTSKIATNTYGRINTRKSNANQENVKKNIYQENEINDKNEEKIFTSPQENSNFKKDYPSKNEDSLKNNFKEINKNQSSNKTFLPPQQNHKNENTFKSNSNNKEIIKTNSETHVPIDEEYKEDLSIYELNFPDIYHGKNEKFVKLLKQEISNDGKILKFYENNKKEVVFPSGMRKEIYEDGYTIVYFANEDIKQSFPDGKTVYFFNESNTVQNTFPDGLQVFKFEDGQIEKHHTDGAKEIIFPDGTLKYILNDGDEETFLPDGTLHKLSKKGIVTIDHFNGERETIYPDGIKLKEYTNGKIIKTYPDGNMETIKK